MVAVVVPVYKAIITGFERFAFIQLLKVLNKHTIILCTYEDLDLSAYLEISLKNNKAFEVEFFNRRYFSSIEGYNNLLMMPSFYKKFRKYKFILIYQLDAFVFRDELSDWAEKGYDYIGAPWFFEPSDQSEVSLLLNKKVGNGGLSLRKVKTHIKALNSYSRIKTKSQLWSELKNNKKTFFCVKYIVFFLKCLGIKNNIHHFFDKQIVNEDIFWSVIVQSNLSWFKTPDWKEAIHFSFETRPRDLYELTNFKLPFGCHAWWKIDFYFWEPIIMKAISDPGD